MKEYIINLPVFEGPFDLLYHLIKKQEIDIWSVPIADITEQYLDYLQIMGDFNLEIASDFLVMAATLLRLKSKLLLPVQHDEQEIDVEDGLLNINSSEELIKRILEYRLYKKPADFLREREEEQQRIFFRSTGQPRVLHINKDESVLFEEDLSEILMNLIQIQSEKKKAKDAEPQIMIMEEVELKEKIGLIVAKLKDKKKAVYIDALYDNYKIEEIIVTFIAILELARQKKIKLMQHKNFGPILIDLTST